jgi:prepilin-type N-terminal cleavage/methylation domain-containing protein
MKPLENNKGFTLIEVLGTTLILGLIIVIAIPNFNITLKRNRLNGAVRDVYEIVLLARQRAITQHKTFYLDFDPTTDRFAIKNGLGNNNTLDNDDFTTVGGNGDTLFGLVTATCSPCDGDPTGPGVVDLMERYDLDILSATTDFSFNLKGTASTGNKCILLRDTSNDRIVRITVGLISIDKVEFDTTNSCP